MLKAEEKEAQDDRPSHAPHGVIPGQPRGQQPEADQIGPDKAEPDQQKNGRHVMKFAAGYRTWGIG
jgi:hypothetical protein